MVAPPPRNVVQSQGILIQLGGGVPWEEQVTHESMDEVRRPRGIYYRPSFLSFYSSSGWLLSHSMLTMFSGKTGLLMLSFPTYFVTQLLQRYFSLPVLNDTTPAVESFLCE